MIKIDPPRHIAVVNKSKVSTVDFVWMVAACAAQVREHLCPAWGLASVEVAAYTDELELPDAVAGVIFLADTDGNPDSLGYHTQIGKLAYGFVDVDQTIAYGGSVPRVLSHEVCEMVLDQNIDTWAPGPDGLDYAVEACDPVEAIGYSIEAEIDGQTQFVPVSDFILPSFFDATAPIGDYLGRCKPFEILDGGYQIARRNGAIIYLPQASEKVQAKLARSLSRTSRR